LRQNLRQITHVVPVWFHLKDEQGNISSEIDTRAEELARNANVPILPLINNYQDAWRAQRLHMVLQSAQNRARLVRSISTLLSAHRYAGINVDFELLQERDRNNMIQFMKELYQELHGKGLLVTQSVPADDAAYDLKGLSQYADYLIPMFYDEHFDTGKPGPLASQTWFESMFRRVQKEVPGEKIIAGLGNFGYDWVAGSNKAVSLTFSDIQVIAGKYGKLIDATDSAQNPYFSYWDGKETHEVWFLNARTLSDQWALVQSQGGRGLALWRLGAEDPGVWTLLAYR
jgi:spore germination protein YaaH